MTEGSQMKMPSSMSLLVCFPWPFDIKPWMIWVRVISASVLHAMELLYQLKIPL
ncbi:MAG TPA: hypothetical protein VKA09_03830 [Nitrososphaeraceae archaeon]|nr:hypothetical protein [Nitrososphaeraceae archaeon]